MAEGSPEYYPTVSVHLSRVLEDLGLNTSTIKRRRKAFLMKDELMSMHISTVKSQKIVSAVEIQLMIQPSGFHQSICNKPDRCTTTCRYTFGSQVEGTTTPGLHSDMDILMCNSYYNAIQDWSEWVQGKTIYLLLQEDTAPGHRRLQLLRPDVPLPREDLLDDNFVYDGSGRVLLKSTLFRRLAGYQVNGPAMSEVNRYGLVDNDNIAAIRCSGWPREADEWKRRYQNHPTDWITLELIQKAEAEGFFLVPVGYKLSETPEIEWRVSLSYTERLLMFSMNRTMLQCYTVLKLIVKTFITPKIGKTITSYHCKTVIFHCIERTGIQFWRENKIIHCIDMCLNELQSFLENGKCVHFIMSEVNLFDGKITPNDEIRLLEILSLLTESKGRYIFSISVDSLGTKLLSRLNNPNIQQLDIRVSAEVVFQSESSLLRIVCYIQMNLLNRLKENDPRSAFRFLHQTLQKHRDEMRTPNINKRRANEVVVSLLSSWIGSILSSVSLFIEKSISYVALRLFIDGTTYFITSFLKLASALFISGDLLRTDSILRNIDERFQQDLIIAQCYCNDLPCLYSSQIKNDNLYKAKTLSQRLYCFAGCVIFTQQDMYCAPPALRNEMHRSMGDDMCHRDPEEDWWMDFAVVDSLPFLYYLQYLTYGQLEQRDLQKQTLQKIIYFLKTKNGLGHLETGWNLLGQCMEQEQDHNAAMSCYQTSLEIRPRNNAANWHIQNLQYRKIRGEI